jgi:RNA polymerase sigma-70 factor (ECF subfamily)
MTALRMLSSNDAEMARSALSLREIVLTHGKYVWRLLRYLGVADRDLDDVCQEVFTTVHKKLGDLQDDGVRPWLYAMCTYHARNYRRHAGRHRETLMESPPESFAQASQEETVDRTRARELLLVLLDRLDEDKRTIFVLHAIEEIPMAEVARLVSCPQSTAYFRFKQAKQELEKGMKRG